MNEVQPNTRPQSQALGCLSELSWLGAGFVMPCASLTFYRRVTRRRVIWAVLFFTLFSLMSTVGLPLTSHSHSTSRTTPALTGKPFAV
jgi:hypothetical protein